MKPAVRAAWAAVRRRRVQSVVIAAVTLLSSATALLGIGLLVASTAPFEHAFSRLHGAHAAVTFDSSKASAAEVEATATRPGVTAAIGPFDAVSATLIGGGKLRVDANPIVGRAEAGTAVDRLQVTDGSWLTGPGQIVLSRDLVGDGGRAWQVGTEVTVGDTTRLKVVGIADSITGTAAGWVWPTQSDLLGSAPGRQMLYRFASAGSNDAIRASVAEATAGLPRDAVTGTASYLAVKLRAESELKPMVPFVVAFAVLGLIMSVLIVVNVVAGAVVSGFRTIGIQKTLGFTPGQVVAVYAGQILAVCVPATVLGDGLGRLLAVPLLAQTAEAYAVSDPASIPLWADLVVLLGVPAVVGLAAIAPAVRAGRYSAVQAITIGRAPRNGRGLWVRRALAATPLPRPVSFGLGTPFARPTRAAVTVVAVLLGAVTVVFAVGLATTLNRAQAGFSREAAVPVTVDLAHIGRRGPVPQEQPADPKAIRAAIEAQQGTARVVGLCRTEVDLAGLTEPLEVEAYDGDATWVGYRILSGRWYQQPDEAVAGSRMLRLTGIRVGDEITLSTGSGTRRVHIVGEVFSRAGDPVIVMGTAGLTGLVEDLSPNRFEIALADGTDARSYVERLTAAFGDALARPQVTADTAQSQTIALMLALIATLSLLICTVAALGVLNTVVLNTRDRVHEIGVLKSLGMTPRQVQGMVVTSMVAVGALAGALAVPVGYLLHHWIVPVIGDAAGTGVPHELIAVYAPLTLAGLGASGIALAVFGALIPAGWAARTRAASALRAE